MIFWLYILSMKMLLLFICNWWQLFSFLLLSLVLFLLSFLYFSFSVSHCTPLCLSLWLPLIFCLFTSFLSLSVSCCLSLSLSVSLCLCLSLSLCFFLSFSLSLRCEYSLFMENNQAFVVVWKESGLRCTGCPYKYIRTYVRYAPELNASFWNIPFWMYGFPLRP